MADQGSETSASQRRSQLNKSLLVNCRLHCRAGSHHSPFCAYPHPCEYSSVLDVGELAPRRHPHIPLKVSQEMFLPAEVLAVPNSVFPGHWTENIKEVQQEYPHVFFESPGWVFNRNALVFHRISFVHELAKRAEDLLWQAKCAYCRVTISALAFLSQSKKEGLSGSDKWQKPESLIFFRRNTNPQKILDYSHTEKERFLIFQFSTEVDALHKYMHLVKRETEFLLDKKCCGEEPHNYSCVCQSPFTYPARISSIECSYCVLDKKLHQLEFEFDGLIRLLQVLPMRSGLPENVMEALAVSDLSRKDKKKIGSRIAAKYKKIGQGRDKDDWHSFNRTPTFGWHGEIGWHGETHELVSRQSECPWNYQRCKELGARLSNVDVLAGILEKRVDTDIAWYAQKKHLCPPGDWVEHRVPFSQNGWGFWNFSNSGFLLSYEKGERRLVNALFYHSECIFVFLSMVKADIDGLFMREHKGFSDRYFVAPHLLPEPSRFHPVSDGGSDDDDHNRKRGDREGCFNPLHPHYVQNGNVDPRLHRARKRHECECEYCVLDRMIVQLETDMDKMFTYQQQWRFSDTYMRLGAEPFPPFPQTAQTPSPLLQSPKTLVEGAKRARVCAPPFTELKPDEVSQRLSAGKVDEWSQRLGAEKENEKK